MVSLERENKGLASEYSIVHRLQNDHEKQTRREQTLNSIGAVEDKEAAAARALPEAAALYKKQDLSLGEGSTLRCAERSAGLFYCPRCAVRG